MKGKSKKKKVGKIILFALSFLLTIVLTASITLAWFYDSDWASNSLTMAGSVGIEMRDGSNTVTSGNGALHFSLQGPQLAYPGQAIDVEASVFNNGGTSIINHFQKNPPEGAKPTDTEIKNAGTNKVGSPCYIRAYFEVFTNITEEYLESDDIYKFLADLITARNGLTTYKWVHYQNTDARMTLDGKTYYQGSETASATAIVDPGYFYLCTADAGANSVLYPLPVGETAIFLWDGQFVLPWQLTNLSADKMIYVGVKFEAIQTFIPKMTTPGKIDSTADNQLPEGQCTISCTPVQTIFNTCQFQQIEYKDANGNTVTFDSNYNTASKPNTPSAPAT